MCHGWKSLMNWDCLGYLGKEICFIQSLIDIEKEGSYTFFYYYWMALVSAYNLFAYHMSNEKYYSKNALNVINKFCIFDDKYLIIPK